jgi:hypothetical protein
MERGPENAYLMALYRLLAIYSIRAKFVTSVGKMFMPALKISFSATRKDNSCKKSSKHISNC